MPECCHYGCHENSTLEWVVGWDVATEELTCTVCKEVFGIRMRDKI